MNWEAIGAIGETIGAAGVVATLIYLAVQVRLNRQSTDANTRVNRAASAALSQDGNSEINKLIASSPELAKLLSGCVERGSFDGLAVDEVFRLHMIMRAAVQIMEAAFFRYEEGLLDERIWSLRRTWTKSFVQTPPMSQWWASERESYLFTEEFIAELEGSEGFSINVSGQRIEEE
jgi:hypothetical protein